MEVEKCMILFYQEVDICTNGFMMAKLLPKDLQAKRKQWIG